MSTCGSSCEYWQISGKLVRIGIDNPTEAQRRFIVQMNIMSMREDEDGYRAVFFVPDTRLVEFKRLFGEPKP